MGDDGPADSERLSAMVKSSSFSSSAASGASSLDSFTLSSSGLNPPHSSALVSWTTTDTSPLKQADLRERTFLYLQPRKHAFRAHLVAWFWSWFILPEFQQLLLCGKHLSHTLVHKVLGAVSAPNSRHICQTTGNVQSESTHINTLILNICSPTHRIYRYK